MMNTRVVDNFICFVEENLNIPDDAKNNLKQFEYRDEEIFYLNLCNFFKPLFPDIKSETIQDISCYGYVFAKSIFALDNLVDKDFLSDKDQRNALALYRRGIIYLEEAIRGFTLFFPKNSKFWEYFQSYQELYFDTIDFEESIINQSPSINVENYEKITWEKNALSLLTFVSFCELSNDYSKLELIEQVLKNISIAIQIRDDIADFKDDHLINQKNLLHFDLTDYLLTKGVDYSSLTTNEIYVQYLTSGIVIKHLTLARSKLTYSQELLGSLPVNDLKGLIIQNIVKIDESINLIKKKINI